MLHESRLQEKSNTDKISAMSYQKEFQPTLVYLAEISSHFNDEYTAANIGAMSPFVSHAVYLAIQRQHQLDRNLTTRFGSTVLPPLEALLKHLSKRWSSVYR